MTVISSKLPSLHDVAEPVRRAEEAMPRISKTALGVIGLAIGVGVGLYLLRDELPSPRRSGTRRRLERLERAALDFVSDRARDARGLEIPSFRSAARDTESALSRFLDRWRD